MGAGTEVLTARALGRATLARQMLLAREKATPLKTVERLAGLQAQLARPPFIALWSRLLRFSPEALVRLARERKVVRATMMRGTSPPFPGERCRHRGRDDGLGRRRHQTRTRSAGAR